MLQTSRAPSPHGSTGRGSGRRRTHPVGRHGSRQRLHRHALPAQPAGPRDTRPSPRVLPVGLTSRTPPEANAPNDIRRDTRGPVGCSQSPSERLARGQDRVRALTSCTVPHSRQPADMATKHADFGWGAADACGHRQNAERQAYPDDQPAMSPKFVQTQFRERCARSAAREDVGPA